VDGEVRLARGVEAYSNDAGGVFLNPVEEASRQAHSFHLLEDALPSRVITHGADEGYGVAQDSRVRGKIERGSAQVFRVTEHVP
jgi:hypothetical protein